GVFDDTMSRAPASPSACAMLSPMPRLAPVTSATCPSSLNLSRIIACLPPGRTKARLAGNRQMREQQRPDDVVPGSEILELQFEVPHRAMRPRLAAHLDAVFDPRRPQGHVGDGVPPRLVDRSGIGAR